MKATYITEITDIHVDIVNVLLKELKKNKGNACMTYSELSCRIGDRVGPRNLDRYLGDISSQCKDIGAPMLSVMVINKNENKPGSGFFRLYFDLYGRRVKKADEDMIFVKELKAVQRYKHWNQLKLIYTTH